MTDHTPEPYGPYVHGETRHDRIRACVNACAGIPTETLLTTEVGTVHSETPERVIACLRACAGIETEQLGDVKALASAASAALQYIYLAHIDARSEAKTDLEKISKRDFDNLQAALAPFQGTES